MTNRIFIDSSVFIEAFKGNKKQFYDSLISKREDQFYINDVVLSEYLYYILGFNSGVSPRTLQQKKQISNTLKNETDQVSLLEEFHFLSGSHNFLLEVPQLMSDYNLLPNDAIILATCKLHGMKLASHDSDFIIPCKSENIELIIDV
jgi:predicted nucleic acid-binding protein